MILPEIHEFLGCRTPDAWVQAALADQETLLIDHKNCEFKAASTALSLIAKYHSHVDLINMMSRLAREELVHHEQVMRINGYARALENIRIFLSERQQAGTGLPLIVPTFVKCRANLGERDRPRSAINASCVPSSMTFPSTSTTMRSACMIVESRWAITNVVRSSMSAFRES